MMKDIFAALYENDWFGIYEANYWLIFQTLYDDGGYIKFGLTLIFIPLVFWFAFYILWKYPYGKLWHWLLWLIITTLFVIGLTWGLANTEIFASSNQALNEALADPSSGYEEFASSLPMKYAIFNGILALLLGFIYSIILKQFSKVQIHLPF